MTITTPPRTRPYAALSIFILVFLAGAAVGAAGMRLYRPTWRHTQVWAGGGKSFEMEKWKRDLNLTDQQAREIEMNLDDFAKYYHDVLAEGRDRVERVLTPQQRRKFEQMIQDAR